MRFVRLDPDLPAPSRNHPGDAGVDLRSRIDTVIMPGAQQTVPTGIAVEVPAGHAALVCPRSGLAAKHGLTVVNSPGVIDSGYTGEVGVILATLASEPVVVSRGERIAQLVVVAVSTQPWEEVDALDDTARGASGFGSSGTH